MKEMFEPVEVGGLKLKNRLVRSATWEAIAAPDGGIDERTYAIYDELARGGVGLIITGFTSVAGNDRRFGGMMRLHDDVLVPRYAKLVDVVHAQNVPIVAQLALGAFYRENGSPVEPDAITASEISLVESRFVEAAVRAKAAGFDGVLFHDTREPADAVLIAITGIHGNFYSNPFYVNFGETLNAGGIDFVYAQTCDAFSRIETEDWRTGERVVIGSQTEDFNDAVEDVGAYVDWAEGRGYAHIYLAGHSLGANKVIRYLNQTHDSRVERFILLSPANLTYMTSGTTEREKALVREYLDAGRGEEMLPFALMGWAPCVARTAHQWLFEPTLNNAHTEPDGDFSQAAAITHTGMLLVGTYDNFTKGDPVAFLENINSHMPTADENELVFVERTGHTYQMKEQEVADVILETVSRWLKGDSREAGKTGN